MVALTLILIFDRPCTGYPYVLSIPVTSSHTNVHDGLMLDGILQVIDVVFDPISVFPLYVVIVNVIATDVPVVF